MSLDEHLPLPKGSRIVASQRGGELTFDIPPRGLLRGSYGLFPFAVIWLTITALALLAAILAPRGILAQPFPALLGPLLFFSLFLMIGIGVLIAAIHTSGRRVTITSTDDRLTVLQVSSFGGAKQRQWPRMELTGVRVGPSKIKVNRRTLDELQILSAADAKYGLLIGYPKVELEWLAERLASQLDLAPPELQTLVLADVDRPPAATQCVYRPIDDGFTLSVPPAGLWRGSLAVFPMGVAWTACVVIGTILFALFGQGFGAFPQVWLILAGNVLVGIGGMTFGYYLGTRQAEIAVAGGRMLLIHRGLWANWKREWPRDELAAVRAGESTAKVNEQPLMQLQIVPRAGTTNTLLTGRNKQELAWIATLIRNGLDLPADAALLDDHGISGE